MSAAAIIALLQVAIAETPALVAEIQKLFASGTPTAADFQALIAKVSSETYGQFVPSSSLPASETSQ